MDQRQTNTILIFLMISLFLFMGYPILFGSYPIGGDLFSVSTIIIASFLLTSIYYYISEPTKKTNLTHNPARLKQIFWLIFVISIIFLFFISIGMFLINLVFPGPNTTKEYGIGIVGGMVSGILLFFGNPKAFFKYLEDEGEPPKND